MAAPVVISWLKFGWEDVAFGTESTGIDKSFGNGARVSSFSRRNNEEKIYGLGARNAQKLVSKKFEGACEIEFPLSTPWFLYAVMGTVSSDATSSPETHTFTEANTIPSFSVENNIYTDTKSVATLLGCKVNTCIISAAVGELARVRLGVIYADETHDSTTSAQVTTLATIDDVFTFAQGSLELPNGTTIAEVQSIELTINNGAEVLWGLGSRLGQKCPVKSRDYSARVNLAFEASATLLEKLYGASTGPIAAPAETATLELTFTNGLTGTNTRSIVFLFTGVKVDEHNLPQDPTSVIMEDALLQMRDLTTVIAINNDAAMP